jgi:hypothetical protein
MSEISDANLHQLMVEGYPGFSDLSVENQADAMADARKLLEERNRFLNDKIELALKLIVADHPNYDDLPIRMRLAIYEHEAERAEDQLLLNGRQVIILRHSLPFIIFKDVFVSRFDGFKYDGALFFYIKRY